MRRILRGNPQLRDFTSSLLEATVNDIDERDIVAIIMATLFWEARMKIASVKEVKNRLSHYLKTAEKEDVVITKNGKPNAIIHHLGDDEIEDYILEHDPKFRAKIEKRWKEYLTKGGRSIEEILQALGD